MEQIDVLIFYEHAARELDVACAVACLLEREHSLKVAISHWPSGQQEAFDTYHSPKVVALPYCYGVEPYRPCVFVWKESVYVNLAWEQLLYEANRRVKTPSDKFSRKYVIHQAWSRHFASRLKKEGVTEENIFVNGNPALTLYQAPYRDFFVGREALAGRYGLDATKRWVFFPENFNWAFASARRLQMTQDCGVPKADIETLVESSRKSFREIMKWCCSVVQDRNIELIIRPRPAMAFERFKIAIEEVVGEIPKGICLNKEETVREWILSSDLVISSYSTSLIEAAVAGKEAYIVEPYPIPESLWVSWHDEVDHIKTEREFRRICHGLLEKTNDNRLRDWANDTILSNEDSISNLAATLMSLCTGRLRGPKKIPKHILNGKKYILRWRRVLSRWRRLSSHFRKHDDTRNAPASNLYEKDILTSSELHKKLTKWKRFLDYSGPGCVDHFVNGNKRALQLLVAGVSSRRTCFL